jgi:hypothetical protein
MKTTISRTSATTTEHAPTRAQHVPAHARHVAAQLSALFDRDMEIVKQLNDAHHRHQVANEQLRLASDALDGSPQIHWQIHRAFGAYQHAAEQRRQLAVDVGELAHQLTQTLCAAGWSTDQAQRANVHQLAQHKT